MFECPLFSTQVVFCIHCLLDQEGRFARLLGLQRFPALVLLQPVANDVNYHANVDLCGSESIATIVASCY